MCIALLLLGHEVCVCFCSRSGLVSSPSSQVLEDCDAEQGTAVSPGKLGEGKLSLGADDDKTSVCCARVGCLCWVRRANIGNCLGVTMISPLFWFSRLLQPRNVLPVLNSTLLEG